MLDDRSLHIEGIMPGGSKSSYTLPITVYAFSSSSTVASLLRRKLNPLGIAFTAMSLADATAQAAGRGGGGGAAGGGAAGRGGGGGGPAVFLAPAELENSLNRLFEGWCVCLFLCVCVCVGGGGGSAEEG